MKTFQYMGQQIACSDTIKELFLKWHSWSTLSPDQGSVLDPSSTNAQDAETDLQSAIFEAYVAGLTGLSDDEIDERFDKLSEEWDADEMFDMFEGLLKDEIT
jgi:hypothetical protein